jgi:hypothetical protein
MSQRDALRCATRNNVSVNVVSTSGMSTEFGGLAEMAALRAIAEETGGDALVNSNNFEDAFQRFVRDSGEYHLLGYVPRLEHRDGKFHSLAVRVNRPGVTVRARRGYYAPPAESPLEKVPKPDPDTPGVSVATHEALRLPLSLTGLTINLSAVPLRRPGGKASVLLIAQTRGEDLALGPGELVDVAYRGVSSDGASQAGEFYVYKLDLSTTSRAAARADGLRFLEWLALPPGRHQVRFAVHQPNGKTGMVVGDVDVPDFDRAPMSLSGVVIASQRLNTRPTVKGDETLLKLLGAHPTVERSFGRRDVLTTYAEVYTTGPERPVAVATVARANQPTRAALVDTRAVVNDGGRAGFIATMPLERLQPGEYVLTFEARTRRQSATRQVAFSVTER